jgi:putative endonuclease
MWFKQTNKDQHTRARGNDVERLAESFLKKRGLKLLERNYLIKGGEIDLIMKDANVLVFIEVRYRKSEAHGSGAESVTATKQQRLNRAARHYLQHHFGNSEPDCRFDVMSASGEPVVFEWIKIAF